jgi:hypothetical protein
VVLDLRAVEGALARQLLPLDSGGAEGFFIRNFTRAGKVNGWTIACQTMQPTILTCGEEERNYRWTIRGWLSAEDDIASLRTAEVLADTIVQYFSARPRLTSTATYSDRPESEVRTELVAMGEGKYLVHVITIRFTSHERAAVTYA